MLPLSVTSWDVAALQKCDSVELVIIPVTHKLSDDVTDTKLFIRGSVCPGCYVIVKVNIYKM